MDASIPRNEAENQFSSCPVVVHALREHPPDGDALEHLRRVLGRAARPRAIWSINEQRKVRDVGAEHAPEERLVCESRTLRRGEIYGPRRNQASGSRRPSAHHAFGVRRARKPCDNCCRKR